MSNIEEEDLLQMVHDFMESSDSTISSTSLRKHDHYLIQSTTHLTLHEILKKKTEEEKEILEKVSKYMRKTKELEKTSGLKKWIVKCLKLEGLCASFCHTSWVTTPSCPSGSYEYIEIKKEDHKKGCTQRVIVDIDFKCQFEIARPTQSYMQLSSKLPIIFVGNEYKLKRIISLLCSASEQSLRDSGLHIPPWRRAPYMFSKWKLN